MRLIACCLALGLVGVARAGEITVAVASNFRLPAEAIARSFGKITGHCVRLSPGSTGKLYAQIRHGAPYDVFLAADSERPRLLEQQELGIGSTRRTYAIGRLVLWSADPRFEAADCRAQLDAPGELRLSIANPATAPYGAAAQQFLEAARVWDVVKPRLVRGENIAQALQFVATGNAQLGLVARSQSVDPKLPAASCSWLVPASLHAPIEQQAIALARSEHPGIARDFVDYLAGPAASATIRRFGYEVQQ